MVEQATLAAQTELAGVVYPSVRRGTTCNLPHSVATCWASQVKALLHAADISNHVRPFPVALSHAERVQQEFRRQVARERSLGLPVSLHMEAPEQTWAKMEVQFIDYVAGPLWERLAQVRVHEGMGGDDLCTCWPFLPCTCCRFGWGLQ